MHSVHLRSSNRRDQKSNGGFADLLLEDSEMVMERLVMARKELGCELSRDEIIILIFFIAKIRSTSRVTKTRLKIPVRDLP